MATSGDFLLATNGDFLMAMDIRRGFRNFDNYRLRIPLVADATRPC
jgi:hypothetical protein